MDGRMHSFARLTGYGVAIVPRVPFAFVRANERAPGAILVHHQVASEQPLSVLVTPAEEGCKLEPFNRPIELSAVADFDQGPKEREWRIETSVYGFAWPEGFVFQSNDKPEKAPGFDLVSPDGALLYVQGPFRPEHVPPASALLNPGQKLVGEGKLGKASWVEIAYSVAEVPWRIRYHFAPIGNLVLLLTAQAREEKSKSAFASAEAMLASLRGRTEAVA
jgi:hypothetical protein